VQVGQVILADPSPTAPEGLLRRVTAVSQTSDGIVLLTRTAALTDALWQADITADDLPMVPTEASSAEHSVPPAAGQRALAAVEFVPLPFGQQVSVRQGTGSAAVEAVVDPHGSFTPRLSFALRISVRWFWGLPRPQLDHARLVLGADVAMTVGLTVTGRMNTQFARRVLDRGFGSIRIPAPIPIWITPRLVSTLRFSLGVDGAISTSWRGAVRMAGGVRLDGGRASLVREFTRLPVKQGPIRVSVRARATGSLENELSLRINGIIAPTIGPTVGVRAEFAPVPAGGTAYEIVGFLAGRIGGDVTVLGRTIAGFRVEIGRIEVILLSGVLGSESATTDPVQGGVAAADGSNSVGQLGNGTTINPRPQYQSDQSAALPTSPTSPAAMAAP
jgi:hypothetical protein